MSTLMLESQEAQQACLAVVLRLEKLWGKQSALRWLMKVKGYNLETALRVMCLHKQLLAAETADDSVEVSSWKNAVKKQMKQIMKFGKR